MTTHFDIFGLPPQVDLDLKLLEQKHRALSLELHPDRAAGADAHTRLLALERTTALNDAFKVLKDPARRTLYVLKLKGRDLEREDAQPTMPPDFLLEVMERHERLEGLLARRDLDGARKMADEMSRERDEALQKAQAAIKADQLDEAAVQLGRLRYFTRFVEEIDAFEEEQLA